VAEAAAQAESLGFQVEELARTIRAYRDGVEHNPDRLEQVEERLTLIHNLKRKYGSSIAEIMAYRDRAAADLDAMSHSEERIAELKAREGELLAEVGRLAGTLSQARREAGKRLAEAVESELAGLNMHKVRFQVEIAHQPDPEGVILDGASEPVTVTATGADVVEFLISPNPGEPLKPLARIASGGETSRLMLALKSILSQADTVSTLIFDEIDQGVGGRSGHIVGEKLWALSSRHQVICVTHLPQIACFGDTHFSIVKQTAGDRTVTRVQELTGEARVAELAEMLGGAREPGRQAARAMLQQTEGRKAAIRPAPPG
jgi:DNA repair protein RecN (Recombination protein N)